MERTMRVDYHIPPKYRPSQEVTDLISRMLRGNPTERITLKEIYSDPWFRKSFPESVSLSLCRCYNLN